MAARKRTRKALDAMVSDATGDSLATQKAIVGGAEEVPARRAGLLRGVRGRAGRGSGRPRAAGDGPLSTRHDPFPARPTRRGRGGASRAPRNCTGNWPPTSPPCPTTARTWPAATTTWACCSHDLGPAAGGGGGLPRGPGRRRRSWPPTSPPCPSYRQRPGPQPQQPGRSARTTSGQRPEAEAAYRAALAVQRDSWPPTSPPCPTTARTWPAATTTWACCSPTSGRRAEAEAAYRGRPGHPASSWPPTSPPCPTTAATWPAATTTWACCSRDLGQRPEAEAAYRAALALQEQLAADFPAVPDYRQDLASSHNNLGVAARTTSGKRPEAEAAYRAALAV